MKNMTNAEMINLINQMQNTMNILLAQIEENNKTTTKNTKKRSVKKSAPKDTTKKTTTTKTTKKSAQTKTNEETMKAMKDAKVETTAKPTRADALTQKYGDLDARKQFVEMTKVIAAEWKAKYKETGKLVVERKNYKKELYAEANRRLGRA